MRILIVTLALVISSNFAHAGSLTCWYGSDGQSTGADSGNVADVEDSWYVVDTSEWGNEWQTSALFMHWPDSQGRLSGNDCPDTLPVPVGERVPFEDQPQAH